MEVFRLVGRFYFEIDVAISVLDKIEKKYSSCLCPDCLTEVSKQSFKD